MSSCIVTLITALILITYERNCANGLVRDGDELEIIDGMLGIGVDGTGVWVINVDTGVDVAGIDGAGVCMSNVDTGVGALVGGNVMSTSAPVDSLRLAPVSASARIYASKQLL